MTKEALGPIVLHLVVDRLEGLCKGLRVASETPAFRRSRTREVNTTCRELNHGGYLMPESGTMIRREAEHVVDEAASWLRRSLAITEERRCRAWPRLLQLPASAERDGASLRLGVQGSLAPVDHVASMIRSRDIAWSDGGAIRRGFP
jgi:hypothetical protein